MSRKRGLIVLMGSGELTATMVEVHKEIIGRLDGHGTSVFLDTPAGFQLNVDELSQRATTYFRTRVKHPLSVVSYKSKDIPPLEAEQAFSDLRTADYILVGPGSPTYAIKQWLNSPVPEIISSRISNGGCFVAASAAALTTGRFTMPVYEIYKVGEALRWEKGMNILGKFGMNFVVIPHWNNAEGGTHDTRCCFIGASRFQNLAALLPKDVGILGIDEHTACIIDLETEKVEIRGIGNMTILHGDREQQFHRGKEFPLDLLRSPDMRNDLQSLGEVRQRQIVEGSSDSESFWNRIHTIEDTFHQGLYEVPEDAINAILEMDRTIWQAKREMENEESVTQARDLFREMIVLFGTHLASSIRNDQTSLVPLVDDLLALRNDFRNSRKWKEADLIRDCLKKNNIFIEDTVDGTRWQLKS